MLIIETEINMFGHPAHRLRFSSTASYPILLLNRTGGQMATRVDSVLVDISNVHVVIVGIAVWCLLLILVLQLHCCFI